MTNLGHEYKTPECCAPSPSSGEKAKKETRIDYPTLYIRGKDLPAVPDGEFYFIAKGKKVGYRDPVNKGDEKSCEIAVMAFKVKGDEESDDIEGAMRKKAKEKYKS